MFDEVHAITFNYGQRHRREIQAAATIAKKLSLASWREVEMPALANNPASGLTNRGLDVNQLGDGGLPLSFLPGRNLVFLSAAASIALGAGISTLVTGVCQTDYSGYPDCRRETIDALENAVRLGNAGVKGAEAFEILTPLMYLTKADSVRLAGRIPDAILAVSYSWTCYEGGEAPCGVCGACVLRAKGFAEVGVRDPALA